MGSDATSFTLQLSAAFEYRIDRVTIGAGTRYQHTLDREVFGTDSGDNLLTDIKTGFDF